MQQDTTPALHPSVGDIFRFVTFQIDGQIYGIQSTEEWEVIPRKQISPVPELPVFVSGVIIWETRVVPVLDLRYCLTSAQPEFTQPNSILLMRSYETGDLLEAGILIDQINMEIMITSGNIMANQHSPDNGIIGTSYFGDDRVVLLDIKRLLLSWWHTK